MVLANSNRLKNILPLIITEHQSAFTKDRLISDNILLAFESLHCMQNHMLVKDNFMTLKLDNKKAYEWVEWKFLESIMEKMRFTERWINLLMLCITTVSYSIIDNSEPKCFIKLTKGITQGDSLSPFLFLLCTEGLNGLISQATSQGDIYSFSFSRRSPSLTHLLFADDNLFFCRSTTEECQKVLDVFGVYESSSGQQINRSITTFLF